MRKTVLLFMCLIYSASVFSAESYHVSDEVKIYMHRGPSNQYKIKARISSGTPLTFIARNKETKYVHVRTNTGVQGWIESRYLANGKSVKSSLPEAKKQLQISQQAQQEQTMKIEALSSELQQVSLQRKTELSRINEARAKTTAQVTQFENQIVRLQAEIDGMDESNMMGWFLRGGAVAIIGIIIGLIIPNLPKRRRRTEDWF